MEAAPRTNNEQGVEEVTLHPGSALDICQESTIWFGLREKNVVSSTAMITGYAPQEGMGQDALSLYNVMHNDGRLFSSREICVPAASICKFGCIRRRAREEKTSSLTDIDK